MIDDLKIAGIAAATTLSFLRQAGIQKPWVGHIPEEWFPHSRE